MMRKVQKQIYIEQRQESMLKRRAKELDIPESELIRCCFDLALARGEPSGFDPRAWEDEKAFLRKRAQIPLLGGERTWSREELYDERVPR